MSAAHDVDVLALEHGAMDAVLNLTGAAAAADAGLSGLSTSQEIAA